MASIAKLAAAFALGLGLLTPLTGACGGSGDQDHHHHVRSQPGATQPTAFPSSPLVWGDVNFLHTTDTHGWLIGHQKSSPPEPNYSGDFGDFASFVEHMRQEADARGVDLLLVDSGDLHDGTGLSDGFPAGDVDGHESNKFLAKLPYDILAIGNHELYIYNVTRDMHLNFAPQWDGRYLSSNVNITIPDKDGKATSVPVGDRYTKFKTKRGRKVTAFGVIFNFTGNAPNTTVQGVADMVKESWFKEAIIEEPDFFLLVGHMPVSQDNWPLVFNAIRAVHSTIPIFVFGGHTHIRDCVQYDGRSMALESGAYMETVFPFVSSGAKLDSRNRTQNLSVTRRYLDANRNTPTDILHKYHTTNSSEFDTARGEAITAGITDLANRFNLSYAFGTAPQDYYLHRVQYPGNDSLLSLLADKIIPVALKIGFPERANISNVIVANAGSQRFDLLKGPFTRNDQLVVSPFTNAFVYIPNVPFSIAKQVLGQLNSAGSPQRRTADGLESAEDYAAGHIQSRFDRWRQDQWARFGHRAANENFTLGYVTKDSCSGIGDDTIHSPIPYYPIPDYVGSPLPTNVPEDAGLDLIILDFFQNDTIKILNKLSSGGKQYTTTDVLPYGDIKIDQIHALYAEAVWN
ncbi:hypothetical protein BOTBODRAFT_107742 [Botryobasidium botryosum FD-172 SS1]|uniref:Putative 5'-nucleotidase C-terminal domain-containing protein n=1 Tax=Botryobasidium botryosum (strain FD-172 SS1) TaxID=930990 RepID=A0A067MMZ4_BOTB1|nr:hypothetical protein BOTBODRAFT_107742 [Botryobasidium botryosum FD-172 SS1]